MKGVHIFISGRVQGVFFRAATQRTAKDFNLAGWVRNMADGRVEALFEGDCRPGGECPEYSGPVPHHVEFEQGP